MLLEPIVSNANYNVTELPVLDERNILEYIHLKKEQPSYNKSHSYPEITGNPLSDAPVTEGAPVIIFSIDSSGILLLLEGKGTNELLLSPSNLIGRSVHEEYPGKNAFINRLAHDIRNNHTISIFETDGRAYKIFYTPLKKQNNNVAGFIGVTMDVTSQRKAEKESRLQRSYFRQLFENSPEAIVILDSSNRIININKGFENLFQYTIEEVKGKSINELLVPEEFSGEAAELSSKVYDGGIIQKEAVRRKKDGSLIDVSILGYQVKLENNEPGIYGIYSDISKRKKAEQKILASLLEKELLLKEIHHRVKNNLQVISSLLHFQAKFIKDEEALQMFKDSQNRVKSIALIHEKLYQTKNLSRIDFERYIKNLLVHLLNSYGIKTERVNLKIKSENIFMGIDTAIPCGLIINELVSNSLKYAFPEDRQGEVEIELVYNNDSKFTLTVKDNGKGFPEDINFRNTSSLGLQLVMILIKQLDAGIELINNNGTEYKITFSILNYNNRI